MNINYANFIISLKLMVLGMLGIFIVMVVIALLVYCFTKLTK